MITRSNRSCTTGLCKSDRNRKRTSFRVWDASHRAMAWVAKETPREALVLVPPERPDAIYRPNRPEVVNWWAIRYDHSAEWFRRLDDLVGPLDMTSMAAPEMSDLEDRFNKRTLDEVDALARRYHASFLISAGDYAVFPVVHRDGRYRVYDVRCAGLTGAAKCGESPASPAP